MRKILYLDESGDCSFSESSAHKHFLITIISVDSSDKFKIKNTLKKKFSGFIRNGWDKTKEVKAVTLYRDRRFGSSAVINVLASLIKISSLEVSYFIVNKRKISHQSFKNSPYGIAYNYFAGVLLHGLIFKHKFHHISLAYDIRNKETHKKKHFEEYIKTKNFGIALEKNIEVVLNVKGFPSSKNHGLLAVDFFSWAIFRNFEKSDGRFFAIFRDKLKGKKEWYINK